MDPECVLSKPTKSTYLSDQMSCLILSDTPLSSPEQDAEKVSARDLPSNWSKDEFISGTDKGDCPVSMWLRGPPPDAAWADEGVRPPVWRPTPVPLGNMKEEEETGLCKAEESVSELVTENKGIVCKGAPF